MPTFPALHGWRRGGKRSTAPHATPQTTILNENRWFSRCLGCWRRRRAKAFSREVETGSRQENASNQESRAPFRFYRNAGSKCPARYQSRQSCLSDKGIWCGEGQEKSCQEGREARRQVEACRQ